MKLNDIANFLSNFLINDLLKIIIKYCIPLELDKSKFNRIIKKLIKFSNTYNISEQTNIYDSEFDVLTNIGSIYLYVKDMGYIPKHSYDSRNYISHLIGKMKDKNYIYLNCREYDADLSDGEGAEFNKNEYDIEYYIKSELKEIFKLQIVKDYNLSIIY